MVYKNISKALNHSDCFIKVFLLWAVVFCKSLCVSWIRKRIFLAVSWSRSSIFFVITKYTWQLITAYAGLIILIANKVVVTYFCWFCRKTVWSIVHFSHVFSGNPNWLNRLRLLFGNTWLCICFLRRLYTKEIMFVWCWSRHISLLPANESFKVFNLWSYLIFELDSSWFIVVIFSIIHPFYFRFKFSGERTSAHWLMISSDELILKNNSIFSWNKLFVCGFLLLHCIVSFVVCRNRRSIIIHHFAFLRLTISWREDCIKRDISYIIVSENLVILQFIIDRLSCDRTIFCYKIRICRYNRLCMTMHDVFVWAILYVWPVFINIILF